MVLNNGYVIYSNLNQLKGINDKTQVVNKEKVYLSIVWYIGSMFGYYMMEQYNQGLDLKSS